MKLGIETYSLQRRFGDEEAIRLICQAGFDCVDYSFFGSIPENPALGEDYAARAAHMRDIMEKYGIVCGQAHAPFDFEFCDEMKPEDPVFNNILRSMEAASILGSDYIVVHPVLSPVYVDMPEYNLRFFRSLEPYCQRFQIRIAIENIFDRDPAGRCMGRFGTPEKLRGILDRLNSPWFVACVDTGHAAITGTKPEDFIRALDAKTLRLLHIQDTDLLDDDHQLPYMGLQDWDAIIASLAQIGYEGNLSFEVPGYLCRLDNALIPPALAFAAAVGKYMVSKFEALRHASSAEHASA